ncbi:MAG: hypothetical protein SFU56_18545 [Capsulimonadales bacterium]|nr:hypothetical protein [Capsulimonadales bacterium]
MTKRILPLCCLPLLLLTVTGCRSEGESLANAPRADQEKAFRGDPSKAPDSVKRMMAQPPTDSAPNNAAPNNAAPKQP